LNKAREMLVFAIVFLMLSGSVMPVSAAETSDGKGEKAYHYFINGNGTRYNYYGQYFTYEVRAEVETSSLLAAYWDPNSAAYGYDVYNIVSLKDGKAVQVSSSNAPEVTSYGVIENTGVSDAESYFTVGKKFTVFSIGSWPYSSGSKYINTSVVATNIPYFMDIEAATRYLETGDLTGNQNPYDPINDLEEDSTYAFTGFSATSEGKEGNIEVKWTGTTHDKMAENYTKMEYYVSAYYSLRSAGSIGSNSETKTQTNIISGNIVEKGFKRLYDFFEMSDTVYYLSSLKVLPTYTLDIKTIRGKPCYIYFDVNGDITDIDTGHGGGGSSDGDFDNTFYLNDVAVTKDLFSYLLKDYKYFISWHGTSKDDVISCLSPDDTNVLVYCIGEDDMGRKKKYDYFPFDTYLSELHISQTFGLSVNLYNEFEFNLDGVNGNINSNGYSFKGDVYLIPQYKTSGRTIVRGCITCVNIFTGEVKQFIEKDPFDDTPVDDDDDNIVVTPPKDTNDDDGGENNNGLPDLDNISDIPNYFLGVLKNFFGLVGAVPNLLSTVFPFLPKPVIDVLSMSLLLSVLLRVLGR